MGEEEVYGDILRECFDIKVSRPMPGKDINNNSNSQKTRNVIK